jgi:hypothetical protein
MAEELMSMPIDEALPLTRACSHYLNLTSIAETHHRYECTRASHQLSANTPMICIRLVRMERFCPVDKPPAALPYAIFHTMHNELEICRVEKDKGSSARVAII